MGFLCDRYSASSVAFQASVVANFKRADIDWLNNFATASVAPDLWVLLDLTSDEAAKRMTNRNLDRFERESKTFHDRVRNAYVELASEDKSRWLVLDAAKSPEDLRRIFTRRIALTRVDEMSMRILDQVIGHKSTINKLLHLIESGRLPSSWLFVGARAQGKKLIALGIAQAFLCEKSRLACGECPSCRRVYARQSECLILIEPEKGQIKIEIARQIVSELSLSTLGRGRFVIIDDAEKLGPQAANALLKSIEEPPPKTHFILLVPSQDSILRTLRSRSQVVRFGTLTNRELEQLGRENVDSETRAIALQLLEGALLPSRPRDEVVAQLRENVS